MDSTTERPDTVYYEANSNLEAPATEQLDQPASSNEEKAEQAPDPKPLSRDSTSPSNEEPETDGFIALARRFDPLTKEELATDRPSTHSRKSSTCSKEGNITERLVPLLDKGLIDNWDQRTGAIVTFNDGTEGFKLIPKAVAEMEDHLFRTAYQDTL
ncbi:hypothetical protein GGH93_004390 [Coemansia aciculifera]|nr:hypothetical protein GGH93_004390 [Coemansia aciculifera]